MPRIGGGRGSVGACSGSNPIAAPPRRTARTRAVSTSSRTAPSTSDRRGLGRSDTAWTHHTPRGSQPSTGAGVMDAALGASGGRAVRTAPGVSSASVPVRRSTPADRVCRPVMPRRPAAGGTPMGARSPSRSTPRAAASLSGAADDVGRAVAPLPAGLAETTTRLRPETGARISGPLADVLADLAAARAPARCTASGDLMARVRSPIDDRLAGPALFPASIAAAHHVPVRHVHRLFAQEGTAAGTWIRHRRLEESRRELTRSDAESPDDRRRRVPVRVRQPEPFQPRVPPLVRHVAHEWRKLHTRSRTPR